MGSEMCIRDSEQLGGKAIDPPTLMDASIPLELSGEAVRTRLCIFTDHEGRERALRPDLTLPVAKLEAERLQSGGSGEQRYCYNARAYRLPSEPGLPMEFTQIGTEVFGGPSTSHADADLFEVVARAAEAGGVTPGKSWFGDLSIFPAFVDAFDLTPTTADALKRAFRQAGGVTALLTQNLDNTHSALAAQLTGASREEAEAVVRDVLGVSGIQPVGARSLEEIVEGLMAKAASASTGGIPKSAKLTLNKVLSVETDPLQAAAELSDIAKSAELSNVDEALNTLQVRMDKIAKSSPNYMKNTKFGTPFGRRFNYYDGFVFELFAKEASEAAPYAAGGRYDSLIAKLSGDRVYANGVGGVVRPDRMGGKS